MCACECVCVLPCCRRSSACMDLFLSRIIAFEDMRHEFLIHCIFQLSHRGSDPAAGKKLFQGLCVCVSVCVSNSLRASRKTADVRRRSCDCVDVRRALETETQVPRKDPRCKKKTRLRLSCCLSVTWRRCVWCCFNFCQSARGS